MLSVLIPAYNYNICQLVNELHSESIALHVDFEIIVIDDASDEKFREMNRCLRVLKHERY